MAPAGSWHPLAVRCLSHISGVVDPNERRVDDLRLSPEKVRQRDPGRYHQDDPEKQSANAEHQRRAKAKIAVLSWSGPK